VQQGGVYYAEPFLCIKPRFGKGVGGGMYQGFQGGQFTGLSEDPFPQGPAVYFTRSIQQIRAEAAGYAFPLRPESLMAEFIHIQYGYAPFFQ
jgi:hypothetical protein